MSVDADDLNLSWMDEYKQLARIENHYCREPMSEISVCFVYIDCEGTVTSCVYEKHDLDLVEDDDSAIITKERLLYLIQKKKRVGEVKYRLSDILSYNVDLTAERIQDFSSSSSWNESFLKSHPLTIEDLVLSPSIFIFHNLNAVFLFFRQVDDGGVASESLPLRPILKTAKNRIALDSVEVVKHTSTKKVRIIVPVGGRRVGAGRRGTKKNVVNN